MFLSLFFFLTSNINTSNAQIEKDVAMCIIQSGIKHPEIVFRQAILETGWFTSEYFLKRNNLFGFRSNGEYFKFNSWQESVNYYLKWQEERYKDDKEDYYHFLVRIKYASSKEYVSTLKRIKLKELKSLFY